MFLYSYQNWFCKLVSKMPTKIRQLFRTMHRCGNVVGGGGVAQDLA